MLVKMAEFFKRPELYSWKFYRGVVVDNADPSKIGRARVTIDGIFPEGSNDLLPWVGSLHSAPYNFNAPAVGDELCVIFPFEDIYHPFYIGFWNTGTTGSAYLQDDYPNTFGFIYDALKARFNKNTSIGEIVHKSGTGLSIDSDGNLTLTGAKALNLNTTGDYAIAANKFTVTAQGDIVLNSSGNATFSGTGGTTVGSASSQTTVLGSQVMLGGQGGSPVALVGVSNVLGIGNLGAPVMSQILSGSSKVMAAQ